MEKETEQNKRDTKTLFLYAVLKIPIESMECWGSSRKIIVLLLPIARPISLMEPTLRFQVDGMTWIRAPQKMGQCKCDFLNRKANYTEN